MTPDPPGRAVVPERYAVRPAAVADAPVLGRIHVQVWRETYGDLLPPENLAALDADRTAAWWRQNLAEPAPGRTALVGTCDHEVVGFVVVGPARDEERPVGTQLYVLNVLAAHHGTGLAARLLAAALGERAAYLWVLEGNERALAFYRRHGFALDGARQPYEHTGATELRMVRHRGAPESS